MPQETNPLNNFQIALRKAMERLGNMETLPKVESSTCRSQRAELFKELYSYYERSYKQNMWSDYRKWLIENKFKHCTQRVDEFKKTKLFREKITVASFCSYWLGFLKTDDLYYLISVAKDKEHRGENFNRWLFLSIKLK